MKINFTRLAKKISAIAKSFSGHQLQVASCQLPVAACQLPVANCQLTLVSCTNTFDKLKYKNDPLTAGSFSFLYGGQADFLLKRKANKQSVKHSTYNTELLTLNS